MTEEMLAECRSHWEATKPEAVFADYWLGWKAARESEPVELVELVRTTTERGFERIEFLDRFQAKCNIQESSLATEAAIWFGVQDADPQIMWADAAAAGVKTDAKCGWVPYPIPKEVLLTTRMHLTQDQVADLMPILQHFVDTGSLP